MWRPETDSSNLFQLFSTEHGVFCSSSLAVQQAFSSPSPRLQICPAVSAFTRVLRTQTQVLMLGQSAFYLQSPLSSPWNNFNTMFSICIYLVWVYSQFSLERLKTHFGGRCWLNSWRWDVWRTMTWFWCFIKASYYLSMYTYISLFTKIPNYLCAL